ncbi:carbohydrate ABC transporter membrane protein 2, CUT1 family [Micromonospora rhizosphaerae]|uniref:Carbohydrate ABC transporter membrane protein 2, CUT1 family n=1 Tax=Micromonospora rhizosphaerae TaxID=568872 RepID=A0A1C6SMN0_9ACTN|nr:carbohydrate ABC transporter permease [Micromonospora rhizosphaerae]SCL30826.1 carbohydrate ABC transporter membrane protein 2, CUT1 family [Micromonospora rhizosphaerae]
MNTRTHPFIRLLQYAALAGFLVFLAFPLVWMVSTAFKTPQEIVSLHPTLIPKHPTLSNFTMALEESSLVRAGMNSLLVAISTALVTVLISLPASYALVRYRTWLRKASLGWILVSQIFPQILIVIPLFMIMKQFQLLNSLVGLVLVYLVWALPFTLWMLQGYVRAIPPELEQAAAVDGAGKVRTLVSVVLPLLAPGLVATSMFTFIISWNEFFLALVFLQNPELNTLPLALARFIGAEGAVRLGPLAAGSLLATLPGLVFFAVLQRRLTSGLMSGSVKG